MTGRFAVPELAVDVLAVGVAFAAVAFTAAALAAAALAAARSAAAVRAPCRAVSLVVRVASAAWSWGMADESAGGPS
jgi:hypothetical protein